LPIVPRRLLQALAVALAILALLDKLRVTAFLPWWAERVLLLICGVWFVNLVNFRDGLDWTAVAEVVQMTAALALLGGSLCGATIGLRIPIARLLCFPFGDSAVMGSSSRDGSRHSGRYLRDPLRWRVSRRDIVTWLRASQ
jgi:hypothetical protein